MSLFWIWIADEIRIFAGLSVNYVKAGKNADFISTEVRACYYFQALLAESASMLRKIC